MADEIDIDEIAIIGTEPQWMASVEPRDGEMPELAALAYTNVRRVLRDFRADLKAIDQNADLTTTGKSNARRKRLAELDRLSAVATKLHDRRDKIAEAMAPTSVFESPVERAGYMALMAAHIPADPLKLRAMHADALAARDFETCELIERLPAAHPGVQSADMLATLRNDRVAIENPQAVQTLRQHDRFVGDVDLAMDAVRATIRPHSAEADNIAQLANASLSE